jgi:tetratricopeptide (TPR) repeat protein
MSLTDLNSPNILKKCTKSSELIYAGRYEEAKEVLGDLWRGVGVRPNVDCYPSHVAAEVLLQCASLSGHLGSAQGKAAQDRTKDMLTQALEIFQARHNQEKIVETQYELGICYWRAGALDEARVILTEALKGETAEQRGKLLIGRAIVEVSSGCYEEARDILNMERAFFDKASHALQGRWHGQMAIALLAMSRGRVEYLDKAILEFTAAIYHYEEAGHERYCGCNLNNLAVLLCRVGRYPEAHEHLDKAQHIFARLRDPGNLAQVKETRAQVLVAEKRYAEARRVIIEVVDALERAGEYALLTDALIIKGTVQARLGDAKESRRTFRYAIRVGEHSGALFSAGLAALSIIEEHKLSNKSLYQTYRLADRLLSKTQDDEALARLRKCAASAITQLGGPEIGSDFSLPDVVLQLEAQFIIEALERTKGKITRAAKLLGISHQSLQGILNNRHKQLLEKRTPAKERRKSKVK